MCNLKLFEFKHYGLSIPLHPKCVLETKYKFIDRSVYKGKGRPKKTDYEYKDIIDLVSECERMMNKKIDNILLNV